jgi:arylsulfatase A-like enzyme
MNFFPGLVTCLLACGQGPADRPNILFIMTDDHAAHAISAYGGKINRTPHLDQLAKEGVRLDHCFVTNSICTPSRAAILTGKYSHKNGVPVFNRFDGGQQTVAKLLQAAGYHTGMYGKWHLGSDPTGFDQWKILPGQGLYHDPVFYTATERKKEPGYCTDLITDFSIDFLDKRPKDKPFFLMCHHKAPHRNWQPRADKKAKWANIEVPLPETFDDEYTGKSNASREATMRVADHLTPNDLKEQPPEGLTGRDLKIWKYQRYMRDYLACVESVDDNIGRLLDHLDRQGLRDNTLVIYTSDQGFFLGDHGWYDKRFMYEESLKMPFLARWPGKIKPGTTSGDMVLNVDFAPTFLAAAGLPVPGDMQGQNALGVLAGNSPKGWRTDMYYRYYHYPADHRVQPHIGVRTLTHKLIHFNKIDQWELYDLTTDPREMRNLIHEPEQQAKVKELKERMLALKKELGDSDQFADQQPPSGVDGQPRNRK